MTAPTTRETADHAELAALIHDLRNSRTVWDNARARPKEIETQAADALEILLSERAALRGEHKLTLQDGSEAWCSDAAWRWFQEWAVRLEQAERQRDELRKALEWYGEQARLARLIHREGDAGRHALADDGGKLARALLANQGADQ